MDIPSCWFKPSSASLCYVRGRGHRCAITPTLPEDARVKYGREMTQTEQKRQKYRVIFWHCFTFSPQSTLKSLGTALNRGVAPLQSVGWVSGADWVHMVWGKQLCFPGASPPQLLTPPVREPFTVPSQKKSHKCVKPFQEHRYDFLWLKC